MRAPVILAGAMSWLAAAAPAAGAGGEPSEVAVSYLIDVARDRVSLEPGGGTAIIDSSKRKLAEIRKQLAKLEDQLAEGDLEALDARVLDDAAGVIVARHVAFDLSRISVHPVALLKRDGKWLPAPVPGSFENTGITYLPAIAAQARTLEKWMAEQRENRVSDLRARLREKLRRGMAAELTREQLAAMTAEELVLTFIRARQAGNLHLALACLGGLEDPLPPDWDRTLHRTTHGFHRPAGSSPRWSELSARGRVRCAVAIDPGDPLTIVSIGSINPAERSPEVRIRHYTVLEGSDGTKRLRFPPWLASVERDPEEADPIDAPLARAFASRLLDAHPPQAPDDPHEAARRFATRLAGDDFTAVLPHLARGGEDEARRLLDEACDLWKSARNPQRIPPLLLGLEAGDAAAVAFLAPLNPSNARIKRHRLRLVRLEPREGGWLVTGRVPATGPTGLDGDLDRRVTDARLRGEAEWLHQLGLAGVPDRPLGRPAGDELEALARDWVAALGQRDLARMLACVAGDAGDGGLMKSLGNELASGRTPALVAVKREGNWAAIVVRFEAADEEPLELLYPVLATAAGPRILVAETLFPPDSRTREFLNRGSWKRLEGHFAEPELDGLRTIYDNFRGPQPDPAND